jgi:hypothetical protein
MIASETIQEEIEMEMSRWQVQKLT